MPMKAILLLALASGLSATAPADEGLGRTLTDEYHGKVLALRHAFISNSQQYEPDGSFAGAPEEGAWTVYGRISVNKIKADTDQLKVEGERAVYYFDRGKQVQFQSDRDHPAERITITLHLQQPLAAAEEARAILARVFALSPEDVVNSAPDYWQPQLAKELGVQLPQPAVAQDGGGTKEQATSREKTFHVSDTVGGKKVTPPAVLYQREPAFSDAARSRRLQGTVGLNVTIDKSGTVTDVKIVRPLGMGLDEQAVATIRTWQFSPAKVEGQPVAVQLYIETSFSFH